MSRRQSVVTRQRGQITVHPRAWLLVQEAVRRPGESLDTLVAGKHECEDGEDVEEDLLGAVVADALVPLFVGFVVVAGGEKVVLGPRHGGCWGKRDYELARPSLGIPGRLLLQSCGTQTERSGKLKVSLLKTFSHDCLPSETASAWNVS